MTCKHYPQGGEVLCRECDLELVESMTDKEASAAGDTPRSDAMCAEEFASAADTVAAWTALSRQLERQLAAEQERGRALLADVKDYQQANRTLEFNLVSEREKSGALEAALSKQEDMEKRAEAAESKRDNLLARIFRDGGQKQDAFATRAEACEAADKLVAEYIAAEAWAEEAERKLLDRTQWSEGTFDDWGISPWDLEPHYCNAVSELTRRKAYAKSDCAQMIAEGWQAAEAAEARTEEAICIANEAGSLTKQWMDRAEAAEARCKEIERGTEYVKLQSGRDGVWVHCKAGGQYFSYNLDLDPVAKKFCDAYRALLKSEGEKDE